jgi:hypothetical protein
LGLRNSKFDIVILSQAFFKKDWPQRELHALAQNKAQNAPSFFFMLKKWHLSVTLDGFSQHTEPQDAINFGGFVDQLSKALDAIG